MSIKNQADKQYNEIVKDIIDNGYKSHDGEVRTVWENGEPAHTKSLIGKEMRFDNTELPILTTKRIAWKSAIKEILWIWQQKSNNVQDLRDVGIKYWNEWEDENQTIGRGYGYQLKNKVREIDGKELDQVDHLLYNLKNNPQSRRHITNMWQIEDLDHMTLTPCVYQTQWHVKGGKLHLEVRSRSNDMALGNPINIFQYNVLQRMFAQVLGYELGEFIYNIGDAHIYDGHEKGLLEQMNREMYDLPELRINPNIDNFYDFTIDDFELVNYKHGEDIKFEIAI